MPDTVWRTSPLWQASLDNNQTLKNADYHYLITDYLGTPQLAVNSRDQQTWKGIADAFGNIQLDPDNQISLNLRQPGQYYDQESGLYYNLARHYNPQTGRYIEADPLGVIGGLNLYGYANANPLIYMDPYGLYSWPHFVDDASNFSAGFGDAVSLGATKWIRKEYDIGSVDDYSGWYNVGQVAGVMVGFNFVEKGITKGAGYVVNKLSPYVTAYKAAKAARKPVVTAELKIGGRTFKDYNQNARAARSKRKADPNKKTLIHDQVAKREKKTGKSKPNGDMSSAHAEIGALQQAADKGVTKGADAVMKVTGKDLCDYCQKDVVAMAQASKLNSLKIFAETKTAYKTYEWEAGMARFKITETPKW
ncbi:MAG: hypothetical protein J6574_07065 [Gilliamella sp.]|nr:hypothetical protein [Gilliamella sp.]